MCGKPAARQNGSPNRSVTFSNRTNPSRPTAASRSGGNPGENRGAPRLSTPSGTVTTTCEPSSVDDDVVARGSILASPAGAVQHVGHAELAQAVATFGRRRCDRLPHNLRSDALDNRERILDAARAAFAAEGMNVPMREIARRAGVGPATLYRHFPTKQLLATEAFTDQLCACRAIIDEGLADPDPWHGFCLVIEKVCELHARNRGFAAAFRSAFPNAMDVTAGRGPVDQTLIFLLVVHCTTICYGDYQAQTKYTLSSVTVSGFVQPWLPGVGLIGR